jgi:DNA-binding PadR family transcriptional regulator
MMRFGFHHGGHGRHGMRGHGFPGGFGRGGWTGGEERGHGRRRVFDGGELRLVLLRLLADEPRHGYDLIRAIEERTGGAYAPSPGVVYPTLTLLGDMDQIAEQPTEGARKVFAATDEGRRVLAERADEVAALFARLDALGAMRQRTDGMAVRRAFGNLRAVVQNRLGGEEVDADLIHRAVELIDEAARKIERL